MNLTRRSTLMASVVLGGGLTTYGAASAAAPKPATGPKLAPVPLGSVRLKPSIFLTSVTANQRYLLSLKADRFLHNFHKSAGLPVKGESYGGWEARGIAGHSLGHYHSALALVYAQTGEAIFRERAAYISQELLAIQAAHGDGYAGGTTVDRDGKTVDGKIIFEELRKGEIRTSGFDLNGGWVPIYTYHKVFAGALDAHKLCGDADALKVAMGLADYLGTIIEGLTEAQVQEILRAEHGGINESYAELYARTNDARWLKLAQRLHHKAVLNPLTAGRDELDGKHANTQIPKVIGLARLYELNQNSDHAKAAMFFWETVTKDHSYVIGGNSDHEHFGKPNQLATRLDQQTCEACNTYNMLRLTRHLYGWSGEARYFDFYERAHLNHIMSQQDPRSGMFTYFTALASGFGRVHSDPENDFWCCVGSGMESHSKHGDSVWWRDTSKPGAINLTANLYYASRLDLGAEGVVLDMDTAFPYDDEVTIRVEQAPSGKKAMPVSLSLRVPAWGKDMSVTRADKAIAAVSNGYIRLDGLKTGEVIRVKLPMPVHTETMPDDTRLTAFLSGPLVLAADLGPNTAPWDGFDPAIVSDTADGVLTPALESPHVYTLGDKGRPQPLTLRPFFEQHHNRTAVYFRRFNRAEWADAEAAYRLEAKTKADIRERTLDVIRLGEMQPERDHNFDATANTATITHIAERGRLLNRGHMQFDLASGAGDLALQITYAGRDRNRGAFRILVDGQLVAEETLPGDATVAPNIKTYPLPAALTKGKRQIKVRLEMDRDTWASVYECRLFKL